MDRCLHKFQTWAADNTYDMGGNRKSGPIVMQVTQSFSSQSRQLPSFYGLALIHIKAFNFHDPSTGALILLASLMTWPTKSARQAKANPFWLKL